MHPFIKPRLSIQHLLLFGGALVTTASFFPLPSHAKATAGINSNITIKTLIPTIQLSAVPVTTLLGHDDFGAAFGNAHSTHTSEAISKQIGGPPNVTQWLSVANLNLNVDADAPWGFAFAGGFAESGFKFHLLPNLSDPIGNPNFLTRVIFDIDPYINVFANTTKPIELAFARFNYKVTLDGSVIDSLQLNETFLSYNGRCLTIRCEYDGPAPFLLTTYLTPGWHELIIDPEGDNLGIVPAPAPLPILGTTLAFGSVRKLKRLSNQLKAFSMG